MNRPDAITTDLAEPADKTWLVIESADGADRLLIFRDDNLRDRWQAAEDQRWFGGYDSDPEPEPQTFADITAGATVYRLVPAEETS